MIQSLPSTQKFMKQSHVYNEEELDSFRQLEGDCKIQQFRYLRFSLLKSFFLMIPLTLSVVGLFVLKYYGRFRAKVFFSDSTIQKATHIFIVGDDNSKKIQRIFFHENHQYFIYRKLKYKIVHGQIIPIGLNYKRFIRQNLCQGYLKRGLSKQSHAIQLQRYGRNEHKVQPPNYFQYAFKQMTQPFFLIQYLAAVIYLVQRIVSLAILLLVASLLTVSLNYLLLYLSYRKIKQMAQRDNNVIVIRNGERITIQQSEIVPGDVICLREKQEIPCDCILVMGQAYVNEASLTGESIPIGKFPCAEFNQAKLTNRWLYQGSIVLSVKQQTQALSINTGYTSRRGRIIRKILTKKQKMPEFFKSVIYFLLQTYIIGGIIVYFVSLNRLIGADIDTSMIILLFFLFITFSFPPAFPIYFNLAYSYCLARLKWKNIYGTSPDKTIMGTNLKIMCFDKTGTLTEQKVNLHKIYRLTNTLQQQIDITRQLSMGIQNRLIKSLFSTCHTVKYFDNEFQGDEIDLKMFLFTKSIIRQQMDVGVRCGILDDEGREYEVLRINQYESKFQSMSVLVREKFTDKLYVFSKGAPEKMHNYSRMKFTYFKSLISKLSYEGLRTIGFSYKQITHKDLQFYLTADREKFLIDTILLGVVAFENKLKDDAIQTINRLKQARIQPKMITGDNIFIAIQTAMRAGIIDRTKQTIVIEGADQQQFYDHANNENDRRGLFYKVKIVEVKQGQFHITESKLTQEELVYVNKSIAVDNDYLEMDPTPVLVPQIKVFARISPQNKAKIVKTYKTQFIEKQNQLGLWAKITGQPIQRVGMAGDGANDLIALKQADIGMGISNSDASYAATFSISNLLDIDQILRQSKSTQRSIIQICRFYGITNYLSIPLVVLLLGDGTFFSDTQLMYLNLTKLIIINLAIPLSRARGKQTRFKPQSNFLGLENHLVFWGNVLIYSAAYVAAYVYGKQFSGEFVPNPQPHVGFDTGYYSSTFSTTLLFICYNIQPPTLALFLYKSKPWRQYLWRNIILFLIIVINIGIGIAAFFLTNQLAQGLNLIGLSKKVQVTVFIIMLIAVVVAFVYNLIIDWLKLHERQYYEVEGKDQVSNENV